MQIGIRKKLILSFLGIAVIGLVSGAFGYYGVSVGEKAIHEIGSIRLPGVENLLVIAREAENIRGNLLTLSIAGLDENTRMHQYAKINEARSRARSAWNVYAALPHSEEEARLWKQFSPTWTAWHQANEQYLDLNHRIDEIGIADPESLGRLFEQFIKDHYVLAQRLAEILLLNSSSFEEVKIPPPVISDNGCLLLPQKILICSQPWVESRRIMSASMSLSIRSKI
ncbi:MAG: MCP four helix bundle domain-containing protein [Desulfocapsaceae bacterium]|nr:MCP four helix bundle domain-containing protein [Desulfocapsaceae bacterium]